MKDLKVFGIFLIVRLFSIYAVRTFFVPDEYWQSLEVAHKFSFDYGYLTWEWKAGIRSYIYPLIFSFFYNILKFLQIDYPTLLIYGPRVLQALLSSYADFCFYKWSGTTKWAIFTIATSWFWFYTASRTIINSFECALSIIALSQYPWIGKSTKEPSYFIWIIAILSVIRPTAMIIWTPLVVSHLLLYKQKITDLILTKYLPIGSVILSVSTIIDSIAHGSFIITPLEFLKFNLIQDVGSWYGSQPWYWYLSSGFPAILGINFLPFLIGSFVILKNRYSHPNEMILLFTIVVSLAIYSYLPHKEFRFLLPLLPISLQISSRFLAAWSRKANKYTLWLVGIILFLGNLGPALYLGAVHQKGSLTVMDVLRDIPLKNDTHLLFLMPCHSTPLYSHLHVNVSTRILTCEPNFNRLDNYTDEADQFYDNPGKWLRRNYPVNGTLPTHIICFDSLRPQMGDILSRYKVTHQIPHASVLSSTRIGYNILINEFIL